jgi:hypothetical protein
MDAGMVIRLSKCMLFQVTPGTDDPVLEAWDWCAASAGEIIRPRMELTFTEGY